MSSQARHQRQLPQTDTRSVVRWVKRFTWRAAEADWQWLHPCTIGNIKHLIHHPLLQRLEPGYYRQLVAHAHAHGWQLTSCRRAQKTPSSGRESCQRKLWVPVWLLSCAFTATPALAASSAERERVPVTQQLHSISIIKSQVAAEDIDALDSETTEAQALRVNADINWQAQQRIHNLLVERWHVQQNDPPEIGQNLQSMAAYYSQFPAVAELFAKLEQYDWRLGYAPKTFATHVSGTRMQVDEVSILFDPYSAAQFKFQSACIDKVPYCVASPADVLLHEFLHAKSVLSEPRAFLSQGGMSSVMYPYEHERKTIIEEKALYVAMTAIDNAPRPLRSEHSGRPVEVACATCLN